jgi:RNA polymerase sigma-70 factor (ECF subfamily)
MAEGPVKGLLLLDKLGETAVLQNYHLYHAARADLLRRAGWYAEAAEAYAIALELAQNSVERTFLQRRLAEVEALSA